MVRILLVLLLSCCAANAQTVQQSGNVTPGHAACWAITGVVYDCGSPGGGVSVVGSTTQNDFAAFNGSGSLIDSGISPSRTSNISALWNFNGGLTASTFNTTGPFSANALTITGAQATGFSPPAPPQVVMGQSVASASSWLSTFTYPYGPYAWITGQHGNGALLLGNHTSEWSPTLSTVVDVITSQVYGYHDNPSFTGYSDLWTNYWVAARTASAYPKTNVQILEASFINNGTASQGNPVYLPDGVNDPFGSNNGFTVDCGLGTPGVPVGNPCTTAYQVINNGQAFYTGLRMTINSIVPSLSGFYEAIQLSSNPTNSNGTGHAIVWYTGTPCSPHPCSPVGLAITGTIQVDSSNFMRLGDANGLIYTASINDALFIGAHNNLASGPIIAAVNTANDTFPAEWSWRETQQVWRQRH